MTALKELIKNLESERKKESDNGFKNVYSHIIESAKGFLEKEKQQICDAYGWGVADQSVGVAYEKEEYYFKDNYEQ